ncbi:MAG TPA: hypothetical protein VKX25_06420 [Bryobacteraceae bacterium]|jgi:hypothetical protein|nr:hypothetical protein [Bryobacteraceae bacterium]
MSEDLASKLALGAYFSPMIPVALGWYCHLTGGKRRTYTVLLSAASVSLLCLFAGVNNPAAIGPYYSNARFAVIDVNFLVSLAVGIVALGSNSPGRLFVAVAGLWLAAVWAFVAAINSVV